MPRRQSPERRILVFNPGDDSYGIDRVLLRVVGALRDAGYEVTCALEGKNPGTGWASAALTAAGVSYVKVPLNIVSRTAFANPLRLLAWMIAAITRLPALVRLCRRCDVVYVNGFVQIVPAVAARLARRPVIWHLHEIPPGGRWAGRIVRRLSNRQVCVSHAVAASFELTTEPSSRVVHNAVAIPARAVVEPSIDDAHPLEIGIVARINQAKGHLVLADAFLELIAEGRPVRLHIVGSPHASDDSVATELRRRLESVPASRLAWVGEVKSGSEYMQQLHVLAAPSNRPDPFPLSVLEGMAAGLVVVASDSGGHPEAVTNRVTGLLVAPGDARELADALRELVADQTLRAALGAAARDEVARSFSAERFDAAIRTVVDEMCARR